MKKRIIFCSAVALLAVVLSVLCFVLLPDRVTVNISFKGEASYMGKTVAIIIPFALSLLSVFGFFLTGNNEASKDTEKGKNAKYILLSFVGVLLLVWLMFRNL